MHWKTGWGKVKKFRNTEEKNIPKEVWGRFLNKVGRPVLDGFWDMRKKIQARESSFENSLKKKGGGGGGGTNRIAQLGGRNQSAGSEFIYQEKIKQTTKEKKHRHHKIRPPKKPFLLSRKKKGRGTDIRTRSVNQGEGARENMFSR